jgi:hypothetical protein
MEYFVKFQPRLPVYKTIDFGNKRFVEFQKQIAITDDSPDKQSKLFQQRKLNYQQYT